LRDADDIASDRLMRLAKRRGDAANRAEKADRRNRPGDIADDAELGFEPVGFGCADVLDRVGDILNEL